MTYRQRNKTKHKGVKIIGSIFLLFLILRLFNVSFVSNMFDGTVNYFLESNVYVLSPIKNTLMYFKDKKDLQDRVQKLQSENTDLKLDNLLNKNITQEFEYFKNQFGEVPQQNNMFKVILRPPFTPFDMIKIAGKLDAYNVGDFVFYKNILIGKISEKDNQYATVELLSSPDKKIPVTVKGTQLEAQGLGGGRYVFETSKEFDIKESDPIVYPNQTVLILGVVEFIETKEQDLFKKIYFNLPTSLDTISYVSIGMSQKYEQQNTNSN
jgi:cell shape-determining protein MreC